MRKLLFNSVAVSLLLAAVTVPAVGMRAYAASAGDLSAGVAAHKINPTTVEIVCDSGRRMTLDFYGPNIFRLFRDDAGGILRDPQAEPPARILVDNPRRDAGRIGVTDAGGRITVATERIEVNIDKRTQLMTVVDKSSGRTVLEQTDPIEIGPASASIVLREDADEYFYGGGVQNGRFSHKGKTIAVENQNNWVDGGVASPTPYYWSTNGYGIMWYTFKKGRYDFGASQAGRVKLSHEADYFDIFVMVDPDVVSLLNDFYQLTGHPVLLPKYGFYEGHLNVYNRDYWAEDEKGILFEDGKRYKESQHDNGGVKESLNGENDNYQFSARGVIDRYARHDMPLGWLVPNDGYGAGYGQTETLDGNIQNLRELGDYARKHGVEIGLWTQSSLHPRPDVSALLQRDIVKEVRDAGVRVLKTDVAWVGAGYSFGLNGISDAAQIMTYYGNDARPFIISVDGWAGTQRYAGIWTGDQTGGDWEYIRFHIPTYIGSGLSGQPNISSDMDGIYGGGKAVINTRDYQWKTFSPMQLNMDGWGTNQKYPHALGEPAASINRWYLKLKSELMPYIYSIAREAVDGMPMVRAMMLEEANRYTLGTATRYQYMFGPWFLVAPVYQDTAADSDGNDIRNGIYLPAGEWVDYFTGDSYEGGRIINTFAAPLWKLPLFVRRGAIIPMTHPNNNPSQIDRRVRLYELYPAGRTSFTEYDDDGSTEAYRKGEYVTTRIESSAADGRAVVTIYPTAGRFGGFEPVKSTELRVNVTSAPRRVTASVNGRRVKLTEAASAAEFAAGSNVWYYDAAPEMNRFATEGSEFAAVEVVKNPVVSVKLAEADITAVTQSVTVDGYIFAPADRTRSKSGALAAPQFTPADDGIAAHTVRPSWSEVGNADFYEIEFNDMLYSTIRTTDLTFGDLVPETDYTFRLRAVNADGCSEWAEATLHTSVDPLEFAVRDIRGWADKPSQGSEDIRRLFDFDEMGRIWHSRYGQPAVPFNIIADLRTVNTLDKMWYLPRLDSGNGTILKGKVYYSMDRNEWIEAGDFAWERSSETKEFCFEGHPAARFVKLSVSEAVGKFGSGRELYVFRVPGTESWLQGDVNNDGKIDRNDITSYMNYMGLRRGDADFEGYISRGDINGNDLIDAYDVSVAATHMGERQHRRPGAPLAGEITLTSDRRSYNAGETVTLTVRGKGLSSVNALSFALPYDQQEYEFVGIEPVGMKQMENLTNDRLHTNGMKVLYPAFVNVGDGETVDGDGVLMVIRLKARKRVTFDLHPVDGFMVDRGLNTVTF